MLKRIVSGAVFVLLIVGFFFLRAIDPAFFEILILAFAAIGTYEMLRAFGNKITTLQKVVAMVYAGLALLSSAYPSFILITMTGVNALSEYSFAALLLVFVISPFADTFAYFIGSALKGPKLCPKISPNKTVSGAIGGVVGGVIGAVAVYLILGVALSRPVPPWWFFVVIGAVGSVVTEFGDLVESIIKRKIGIKDMGNIMPGHGGVMDRIDGMIFISPIVFVCFRLLLLF